MTAEYWDRLAAEPELAGYKHRQVLRTIEILDLYSNAGRDPRVTVLRASRVLRAPEDASSSEQILGIVGHGNDDVLPDEQPADYAGRHDLGEIAEAETDDS